MFRAKFVGSLATLQCIFLGAKGIATLLGIEMTWTVTLIPLWLLLSVAVVFWGLVAVVWSKLS